MPLTININNLTLCHKGSNGITTATIPDVCKTPTPGGPVPIPYPNIAMSSDLMKGTTTVKADGGMMCANYGSEFFKSTGDEPGSLGGVVSSVFIKEATWISFSFDVKLEGKAACRLTDKMFHNHMNTVNAGGLLQAPLVTLPWNSNSDCQCNTTPAAIPPTCDSPMSGSPNSGCDYYRKRQEDYEVRHTCPECRSHPPPDYYIKYGLKYCEEFSSDLDKRLSPAGKKWLTKARCALQKKMEDGLQQNPEMELDSSVLRTFAFETHPSAYLESGISDLPLSDMIEIAKQPNLSEWGNMETWKQAGEVGKGVIKDWGAGAVDWSKNRAKEALDGVRRIFGK